MTKMRCDLQTVADLNNLKVVNDINDLSALYYCIMVFKCI